MAAVVRSDRFYLGCGNLAGAVICLPLCWGLPSPDWAALKFGAALGSAALGANAARLLSQHSESAPIRAAWKESVVTVDAAWIEQLAIANLPPNCQLPVSSGRSENYLLPVQTAQLNFQPIAQPEDFQQPPERGDDRKIYGKMPGLNWYPSVLIYGIPGAGKTTFVEGEVKKRLAAGHQIIALDPHTAFGQWEDCEVVGAGMDYAAIDSKMVWFEKEIERRYKIRKAHPNPKFEPLTIVTEEFTNWATRCKHSDKHFKTVNSDIRKVECYSIIVTQTRTLAGLGDAKGMASLRDEAMLEVQILGDYSPHTQKATPRFEVLVKMPGQALSDRTLVKIDRHQNPSSVNSPQASSPSAGSDWKLPQPEPENSGSPYGISAEVLSPILKEILESPGKVPLFSDALELPHEERLKLTQQIILRNLGTETTILCLWGIKSGGRNHQLYAEARVMLDRLIEDLQK